MRIYILNASRRPGNPFKQFNKEVKGFVPKCCTIILPGLERSLKNERHGSFNVLIRNVKYYLENLQELDRKG